MGRSSRNRAAGIHYELDVIKALKEMGFKAVSSRYESKRMDDDGIDIVTDFPFKIQCKSWTNVQPNIHTLLTETAADLILYRKTEKKGTRFYKIGEYAMLEQSKFFDLVQKAYKNEET